MKTAIILHGMPSKEGYYNEARDSQSNSHWLPWIQKHLLLNDILAQTPELPLPYEPDYDSWKNIFEQFTLNEETVLVGHSCGAGFLIRWLSENNVKVGKVALVAPYLGDPVEGKRVKEGFFDFSIDGDLVSKTDGIKIFYSKDDEEWIGRAVDQMNDTVKGLEIETFEDRGHFTLGDMETREFVELKDFLLS
jgi:predicted alpha/beta hydrolase family esterase